MHKRIEVLEVDLGVAHSSDWVVVFDTDPDYERLRAGTNNNLPCPLDPTDKRMMALGYTQYTFDDILYEEANLPTNM